MEAPKCRLCGSRHWGVCPTEKASVIKDLQEMIVHPPISVVHKGEKIVHRPETVVHAVVHSDKEVVHTKHGVYADLEKRKAYRREWMRKRRKSAEV